LEREVYSKGGGTFISFRGGGKRRTLRGTLESDRERSPKKRVRCGGGSAKTIKGGAALKETSEEKRGGKTLPSWKPPPTGGKYVRRDNTQLRIA